MPEDISIDKEAGDFPKRDSKVQCSRNLFGDEENSNLPMNRNRFKFKVESLDTGKDVQSPDPRLNDGCVSPTILQRFWNKDA